MSKGFKMFLVILAISLIAPAIPRFTGIDDRMDFHARYLDAVSDGNLKLTNAHFGRVYGKDTVAQCSPIYETITIDKKRWDLLTFKQQIILLAHEGGHCLKDLDHTKDRGKGLCPAHFMHPYLVGKWCAENYWNKYVKQMKEL